MPSPSALGSTTALLVAAFVVAACGTPGGGDPGGRRLHELGSDPVFAAPDGATMVHVTRTPARYRQPGFSGGGWDGPTVEIRFKSSAPPAQVYGFYARRAAAAGWQAVPGTGALGFIDKWMKTYPDGAAATLLLSKLPDAYILSGGVAPRL